MSTFGSEEYDPVLLNPEETAARVSPMVIAPERITLLAGVLKQFGLPFNNTIWPRLNRAFIHRSYRTEAGLDEDNERLEFLGDSVIGLATTEYLLRKYPTVDEGWLSKARAAVVSRAILGEVGKRLNLGQYLLLGQGEEKSGGRSRVSILGSTLEAACGVFYLHYKWEEIRDPLRRTVVYPAMELVHGNHLVDHKSRLQEWTQKEYQQVPEYTVISEGGPDHSKTFEVEVRVGNQMLGKGEGRRKKVAENEAARAALLKLGITD